MSTHPGETGRLSAARLSFKDGGSWVLTARTHLLGILNVTLDSFSDGGLYFDEGRAAARAAEIAAEGGDAVDIGGESTRPGAGRVPPEEERRRVIPVVRRVRREQPGLRISVDTTRAAIAREAIDEGADIVNDISALTFDPEMARVVADSGAACILMHMKGTPRTMQQDPSYDDLLGEISSFLDTAASRAVEAGIAPDRIAIDPGIGFGKSVAHNLAILAGLDRLCGLGYPVLVGASRKSFIGALTGLPVEERLEGSLAAGAAAVLAGASLLRVHDVGPTRRLLGVIDRIART